MNKSDRKIQANRMNTHSPNAVIYRQRLQSGNTQIECEWCGNAFTVRPSDPKTKRFCSWDCRKQGMRGGNGPNAGGGAWMKGAGNPNWKEGRSALSVNLRTRKYQELNAWRKQIFTRDGFICQRCGYAKGKTLQAHHIVLWSVSEALRFDLNNGITLCSTCHRWVHSKANVNKDYLGSVDATH